MILAMSPKNILIATGIVLGVAVILGLLIALASKFFSVKVDERITKVISLLPGYNCGACGKAGCAAFGEALVNKEAKAVSGCKVIKPDSKQAIKDYLASTPGPDGSTIDVDL